MEELELEHGHGGKHLNKKVLLIGGVAVAVVLGLILSRKTNNSGTDSGGDGITPKYQYTGTLYYGEPTDGRLPSGGNTNPPIVTPPTPPSPTIPTPAPNVPIPTSNKQAAVDTVKKINQTVKTAGGTQNMDAATAYALHNEKTKAAASAGYTNDDYGIVRDAAGKINSDLSAHFTSAGGVNDYVATHQGKLTQADMDYLHAEKVKINAAKGYTTTGDGHVYDAAGRPVGANGMG